MGFSITGTDGRLDSDPFFALRLEGSELIRLRDQLNALASEPRQWYTLVATRNDPSRLKLKRDPTPAFEEHAAPIYFRGDQLRIQGRPGQSCNINFSSRAATSIAQCIDAAHSRMSEFVELRVPSGRHHVVEFVPDSDLISADDEASVLARASAAAASQILPPDDFSDWDC